MSGFPRPNNLVAPLTLPAEPGKPLTTQGGNTLDDGTDRALLTVANSIKLAENNIGSASDAISLSYDGVQANMWDAIGGKGFRVYDSVNNVMRFIVDGSGNLLPGGHLNFNPTTPALPTNPPVSGTVYQNTTGGPIEIYLPVTGGSAADTAQWALGSTSTPGDWGGADTVAASEVKTLHLTCPNGWYWSITTGATIGTASVLGS